MPSRPLCQNLHMRRLRAASFAKVATALLALVLGIMVFRKSGEFLVLDNRERSDAMVITQGDELDPAYWMGIDLLRQGYAQQLLMDARADRVYFGRTQAAWAEEFMQRTAGDLKGRVKVCAITTDTTADEVLEAAQCLKSAGAHSVLLLSDDYHSRRSLLIFSHLLPDFHWAVAPVRNPKEFGEQWWRRREWIRTVAVQWQHLLWWELVDRWRFAPIRTGGGAHRRDV